MSSRPGIATAQSRPPESRLHGLALPALLIPLADHGDIVTALPFFAPVLLLAGGLAFVVIRDRRLDRDEAERGDGGADPTT